MVGGRYASDCLLACLSLTTDVQSSQWRIFDSSHARTIPTTDSWGRSCVAGRRGSDFASKEVPKSRNESLWETSCLVPAETSTKEVEVV